ncbi:hypothetical protein ACJX0J_035114, partial [Zea mays]
HFLVTFNIYIFQTQKNYDSKFAFGIFKKTVRLDVRIVFIILALSKKVVLENYNYQQGSFECAIVITFFLHLRKCTEKNNQKNKLHFYYIFYKKYFVDDTKSILINLKCFYKETKTDLLAVRSFTSTFHHFFFIHTALQLLAFSVAAYVPSAKNCLMPNHHTLSYLWNCGIIKIMCCACISYLLTIA